MIHDLDETIQQLLIQKVPRVPVNIEEANIDFTRPNMEWETRLNRLTVNCFLYDIRENKELRFDRQRYLTRNGTSGTETVSPLRMDFTYMISVWAVSDEATRVSQEHMLLGNILKTLLRYPRLPIEVLRGELASQPYPLPAWVSQPEDAPKAWEFWGANEWRLKAGISYRLTVAVKPVLPAEVGLVTETALNMQLGVEQDNVSAATLQTETE